MKSTSPSRNPEAWTSALAASHPLDLARVVIVGHSAGGHLGIWAAARGRLPVRSPLYSRGALPVRGIVSLAGPADLESLVAIESLVCGEPVVTRLLGGSPSEVPERYHQGSPANLLPIGVKQVLITGAHDQTVSPVLAERYQEKARRLGDDVTAITVEDAAHFEVIAPGSTAWSTVQSAVTSMVGVDRSNE